MKSLIRGIGLAVLAVAFLGLSGCGADNESTAQQLQNAQGPVPTPTNAGPSEIAPQAKDMNEYIQQQKQSNSDPSKTGYAQQGRGGAKKK